MMIEFINRLTGNSMWVADERKDEYLAAGHILAASVQSAKPTAKAEAPKAEAKKAEEPKKPIPAKKKVTTRKK